MDTLLQRLGLVLDIDEHGVYTPAQIEALRLQAFNKIKAALVSGPQRDESYTTPCGPGPDLMKVDWGVRPEELEPDYVPTD